MKALFLILLISFSSFGWEKLSGYPESIYVIQGYSIESTGEFKSNVELAFSPSKKLFGIVFFSNEDEKEVIPSGTFNVRGCGKSASGVIDGINLLMKAPDIESYESILICNKAIFLRVYNDDEHSTYLIESKT